MDSRKLAFLKAVVGEDGAHALKKAAERSSSIENALIPRAIMAWLGVVGRFDYEGEIPGVDDSYIDFTKSEDGLYSGTIAIGEGVFPFENATVFHVAASVAVALGSDNEIDPAVKDIDLARLGKSIDILAKAKVVASIEEELSKGLPGPPRRPNEQTDPTVAAPPTKQPKATRSISEQLDKKPKIPKPKAPPRKVPGVKQIKVGDKALKRSCPECRLPLVKNEKFVGCLCLRDLASSVKLAKSGTDTYISFGRDLDEDAISTILEALGL